MPQSPPPPTPPAGRPQGEDATSHIPASSSVPRSDQGRSGGFIAPIEEPLPKRIGHYLIKRSVGAGGMGVVYLATRDDPSFTQLVALKVVKRGMDTDDIVRRFNQERTLLSGLNHPNIARLLDGGATEDGRPYFVLEFVEGTPIDRYCDSNRLSVADRLKLFRKVCSAVHHAHQNLIVHRDLKPGNILVTKEGEPKLLDFGIAKVLNPSIMQAQEVTGPEVRLMTPEYASPEQVRGDPLTTASDIYALGVLLYELLTGRRPYRFKTRLQNEIVRVICESDPERPSTVVTRVDTRLGPGGEETAITPDEVARSREDRPSSLKSKLEGDIDDIVLMAMEKVPQKRYASAEALALDLQRHVDGLPVVARRHSGAFYFAGKYVRRHKVGVGCAAAVMLAIVVGGAVAGWQWHRADAALDLAKARYANVVSLAGALLRESGSSVYFPSTDNRVKMTAQLIEDLDSVDKVTPDPKLKRLIALAHMRLGDLAGGRTQNTGDPKEARRRFDLAAQILDSLVRGDPENSDIKLDLVTALRGQADAMGRLAPDSRDRLAMYQSAFDTLVKLPPLADKDRQASVNGVGTSILMSIAGLQATLGEPAKADESYQQAIARREAVYQQDKGKSARREYAAALAASALVIEQLGDKARMTETLNKALKLREEAVRETPDDPTAVRDLGSNLYLLAKSLIDKDNPERTHQAIAYLAEAQKVVQGAIDSDPKDIRVRQDLGRIYEIRSTAYSALKDYEKALQAADAEVSLAEQLRQRSPSDRINRLQLGAGLLLGAEAATKLGQPSEAKARLDRAIGLREEDLTADPGNVTSRIRLANAHEALAAAMEKAMATPGLGAEKRAEYLGDAIKAATKAHSLLLKLREEDKGGDGVAKDLGAVEEQLRRLQAPTSGK